MIKKFIPLLFSGALVLFLHNGCKKELSHPPEVVTMEAGTITDTSIVARGEVTDAGSFALTKAGFIWGVTWKGVKDFSFSDTLEDGYQRHHIALPDSVTGLCEFKIDSLARGTTYFIRFWASNQESISLGDILMVSTPPDTIDAMRDPDGNTYPTMTYHWQVGEYTINSATWTVKNLRTTKYNDSQPITKTETDTLWSIATEGAYCYYGNKEDSLGSIYGMLYNHLAVSSNRLCPEGWHVPDSTEWAALVEFMNTNSERNIAGGKMKEAGTDHWQSPNTGADDRSNFSALPGGGRSGKDGSFNLLQQYANFWNGSGVSGGTATVSYLFYNSEHTASARSDVHSGFSVRCVKNP
ncbi:MAG TPA: fibrobacter succinogenes major paralogous domain-containing protein [Bacteroidales bacterium]|nr:fibrobacter succinogenes major paralogous domain-containing protein [Bacteroidales bacterium]HPT09882.1 fibrobacter succinogenes major paralogous domain-containing protein [Bacteroidales bacterium]